MTQTLSVRGLEISAKLGGRHVPVIRGLSFDLEPGRIFGLVGESGAGKSTVGRAIAQLLPPGFVVSAGACLFDGVDLVKLESGRRRALLGRDIAFIPQSPQTALDPLQTVGRQFDEHLTRIGETGHDKRRQRALAMLAAVHLPEPERVLAKYPHQLSGGMCQRVLIAMAFSSDPRLVVADEPTTALDVTVQGHILRLIADMQRQFRTALIFITHNLQLATQICDDIMVLYAGAAVEVGRGATLFAAPAHPYTRCLELADPSGAQRARALFQIPEQMPGLLDLQRMPGCHFAPRCPVVTDTCRQTRPALTDVTPGHRVACLRSAATPEIKPPHAAVAYSTATGRPFLRVEGLSKRYATRGLLFGRSNINAVKNVTFSIAENEFVALVGESGSGKSTLAKLLVGLEPPSAGHIFVDDSDVTNNSTEARARRIATMQMIFQDSQSALNPRRRVAGIVTQAMEAGCRHASWEERLERTRSLLAEVGLSPDLAMRTPPQLSGGQRQRVNIARALCTRAKLLIADEIVSGLDVSVQAQLLNLLFRLRAELGFAMLFISHDLAVVRFLCSRTLTMYRGEIVEQGETERLFTDPQHPYTRALLGAAAARPPAA